MSYITLAEYAKHRGVNFDTVRKAVKEGRIRAAERGRGSKRTLYVDPAVADRQWKERTLRPVADSGIAEARIRHQLAVLEGLEREYRNLGGRVVPPAEAAVMLAEYLQPLMERLRALPHPCTFDQANQLFEWCQAEAKRDPPATPAPPPAPRPTAAADITKAVVNKRAELAELRNAIASGELLPVDDFLRHLQAVLTGVRSKLIEGDAAGAVAELEAIYPAHRPAEAVPAPKAPLPSGFASEAQKARWRDPAYRAFMSQRIREGMAKKRAQPS